MEMICINDVERMLLHTQNWLNGHSIEKYVTFMLLIPKGTLFFLRATSAWGVP